MNTEYICSRCKRVETTLKGAGTIGLGERIVLAVAQHSGFSAGELRSRKRSKPLARARAAAILIMRDNGELAWEMCGEALGKRDHSTVMFARHHFDDERVTDMMAGCLASATSSGLLEYVSA